MICQSWHVLLFVLIWGSQGKVSDLWWKITLINYTTIRNKLKEMSQEMVSNNQYYSTATCKSWQMTPCQPLTFEPSHKDDWQLSCPLWLSAGPCWQVSDNRLTSQMPDNHNDLRLKRPQDNNSSQVVFVCLSVSKITQKHLDRLPWNSGKVLRVRKESIKYWCGSRIFYHFL